MSSLVVNSLHLILAGLGVFAILFAARTPRLDKAFRPLVFGLSGAIGVFTLLILPPPYWFWDFKIAYWPAGEAIWRDREAFVEILERGVHGFVNIPIVAFLFAPFGLLSPNAAGVVYSLIGAGAVYASWRLMTRMFELDRRASALLLFGLAAFGPLSYSLRDANSSHILLAILLLGLSVIRNGREGLGGVLFGFAAVLKPPLLILGVLYALRGRWKVVAGGLGVCVGVVLASLAVFGWDLHQSWYEATIAPFAGQPVAAYNAQSIVSFIARIESGIPGLIDWEPAVLSPAGKAASMAISALLVALCVAACWRTRPTSAQMEIEVFMAIALVCLVSTLAWSHYFVWLAPAFVILLQRREELGAGQWAVLAALILAMPIEFISPWMEHGAYGPLSNLLTSHLTIAGLIVLFGLARLRYGAVKPASPIAAEQSAR